MKKELLMFSVLLFLLFVLACTPGQNIKNNGQASDNNLDSKSSALESQGCCKPFCQPVAGSQACGMIGGTYTSQACSAVDECKTGCCTDFCAEMTEPQCTQSGGSWQEGSCNAIEKCKKSCCSPYCQEIPAEQCAQMGGTSTGASCASDKACDVSCCTPLCTEVPKDQCAQFGGTSTGKSCAETESCGNTCCSPMCSEMTKEMCAQMSGTPLGKSCQETNECKDGCCAPYCSQTFKAHCDQIGGTWSNGACEQVDECKTGCCSPFCGELSKALCDQYGGDWTEGSCEQVDECKKGCCSPFCVQMTKAICGKEHGYGGDWKEGSCDQYSECKKVCCMPFKQMTTKVECEQMKGTVGQDSQCSGINTLKIQTSTKYGCECDGDYDICEISNDITYTFSGTYELDHVEDERWADLPLRYYFKGKGTETISGISKENTQRSTRVTCFYKDPVYETTRSESNFRTDIFQSTDGADVTVTITVKGDNEYEIDFQTIAMYADIRSTTRMLVSGICPTYDDPKTSASSTINDLFKDGIEYVMAESHITTNSLSGSKQVEEWQPENTFRCDGQDHPGSGTVTWNFELPK